MSDWIQHNGGGCPVPREAIVVVRFRNGVVATEDANELRWEHWGTQQDIIAYRLHETDSQRIDRLERELAELRDDYLRNQRKEATKPKKWEPEGGEYYIGTTGTIHADYADGCGFGTERPTRELAEKARDAMRVHNRALAYVHEHASFPDEKGRWFVVWDNKHQKYKTDCYTSSFEPPIGAVTGLWEDMQKLADDLNSGRVEL